jgi:hypothetical protein
LFGEIVLFQPKKMQKNMLVKNSQTSCRRFIRRGDFGRTLWLGLLLGLLTLLVELLTGLVMVGLDVKYLSSY